ncbi:DASH family cryptochrome [Pedobacter cryoconitis]|uniref:Cryptochrome DASH n=1 Tax=Pedobacter cryoconitis TaxID=188932 RepID=A0A327SRA1_9SPHI|nr:DASH family cryptochrome [Pedobacter cryoconitis]RAJ31032.1 deoxyribodipyrimidine photo-lyase [Pedobacter cryoconitis]
MAKRGLVWFKNDLRLHDNEVLLKAQKECSELVFCYCIEEKDYQQSVNGSRRADIIRFKFMQQSVINLRGNLQHLGGHLIIGEKSAMLTIPQLVKEFEITDIYAEQEYAPFELDLVSKIMDGLPEIEFHFLWGKTLYHKDDIPFEISKIPLTSKAYRIPVAKKSSPRETIGTPTRLNGVNNIKNIEFPSYSAYGFSKDEYEYSHPFLEGGEDAALERLEYYTFKSELLTGYRWSRNKSDGLDYSSKFSPYLALGCISPRQIYSRVKEYEEKVRKNQSTWWLIFELVWRDYFTFKGMRIGTSIFSTQGFKNKKLVWENDPEKFERWCHGNTGIPFIDAHMLQLNQTGYMSNRGRVNCASYLVHDLKINWTWGAAYFESKLIDYDVSSNWMNWHMQAFEIWYTNPVHQSNKYKAQDFIRLWIPELSKLNNIEVLIPWEFEIVNYIKPIEVYPKWNRAINLIKKISI